MPFGRHKGEPLSSMPDEYLDWLTTIDLRPRLRDAVHAEIRSRGDAEGTSSSRSGPTLLACPEPKVARELVSAGLRSVSHRYHPDKGGTHEDMLAVNSAAQWLRTVVERGAA